MTLLTDILTPSNLVTTDTIGTLAAGGVKSATTDVITSAATAPTVGQVLTATSDSLATWQDAAGGIALTERTSNTILGAADSGGLFDITSGTFTQTFDAVATLGADWFIYLQNSGSGDITLDPNGAETIDGLATYVMYPGEVRLVQCDGTALKTIVLNTYRKSFLSSGTYTKPPGYRSHAGLLWSSGASGGRTNGTNNGIGGASGGCAPFDIEESFIGASETVTIGAGGAAFTGVSDAGNLGNDSTFGALVSCYAATIMTSNGGSATKDSSGAPSYDTEGASFASSNSGFQLYGGVNGTDGGGHNAIYGGAGGGGYPFGGPATAGGTSKFGGDGGAGGSTGSGGNGSQPGGGGGGTNTGTQGGAGGDGQMDIWGII